MWLCGGFPRHLASEVPRQPCANKRSGVGIVKQETKLGTLLGPNAAAFRPEEGYVEGLCVCWA